MARNLHRFSCPCCGKPIEFDVRARKARALREGADLDALLEEHDRESERRASLFERAQEDEARKGSELDRMFERAKEDAADDDSKPRNPFDLE